MRGRERKDKNLPADMLSMQHGCISTVNVILCARSSLKYTLHRRRRRRSRRDSEWKANVIVHYFFHKSVVIAHERLLERVFSRSYLPELLH